MRIEMENIGGLEGPFNFEVRKGITNLTAQNTVGKTSIVRGLQAVFADVNPREVMNITKKNATIKIFNGEYSTELQFAKLGPSEAEVKGKYPKIKDHRANMISFALPDTKIIHDLTLGNGDLENFLSSISKADEYKKLRDATKEKIVKSKEMLDAIKKGAEQIPILEERKKSLESSITDLEQQLEKLTVSKEAKSLQKQLSLLENEIKDINKNIIDAEKNIEYSKGTISKTQEDIESDELELVELEEHISDIDDIRAELEKKVAELSTQISHDIKPQLSSTQTDASKLEEQLRKIEEGKEKAGTCPFDKQTCSRYKSEIIEVQLDQNKQQIIELQGWYSEVQTEYQKYVAEIKRLGDDETKIIKLNRKISDDRGTIHDILSDTSKKELEIKRHQKEIGLIEKKKENITVNISQYKDEHEDERREVKVEITKKTGSLLSIESQISEISKQFDPTKSVIELENELETEINSFEKTHTEYDIIYKKHLHGVRDEFNHNVKDMLTKLGFNKNFHSVHINDKNVLTVYKTDIDKQPINTLSTSERYSLAVLIMLTARETYIPDFPLFVLDEVLVSFDPARQVKILDYIKDKVEYVICTRLGDVKGIKVTYA